MVHLEVRMFIAYEVQGPGRSKAVSVPYLRHLEQGFLCTRPANLKRLRGSVHVLRSR